VVDESEFLALDPGFDLPRHAPLPPIGDTMAFDTAINKWAYRLGEWSRLSAARSPFQSGGVMSGGRVWTRRVTPTDVTRNVSPTGAQLPRTLGDVVRQTRSIGISYLVPAHQHEQWARQKGAKNTQRSRGYQYSEGSMCCPESRERASRTIITSEGGTSPSRFKHIVAIHPEDALETIILSDGTAVRAQSFFQQHRDEYTGPDDGQVWRRLTPEELEELNGFERGWTDLTLNGSRRMTDTRRAFLMGNALVVGVVRAIGEVLMKDWRG